jgi:tRNA threonylcarbamoyladenosine biosynthesis protein TsaB
MYILAIDTATNSGGVALSRNSEVIGAVMCKAPRTYSEKFIDYTDFLLEQLQIGPKEIDCFVAANGPGSFTGLRIGIAAAKGFCMALNKPVIGVSTLEALAWRFRYAAPKIAPMIDARRQQIYGALYEGTGERFSVLQNGCVKPPAEWLNDLPRADCAFVGDAAQMYRQTVAAARPGGRVLATDNCILNALCELGYQKFTRGESHSGAELKADYIRPSDAEIGR